MFNAIRIRALSCSVAAFLFVPALAAAQDNPELGDEYQDEETSEDEYTDTESGSVGGDTAAQSSSSWASTPIPAEDDAATYPEDESSPAPGPSGSSDHSQVVGRLGFGFFGVADLPIMLCGDLNCQGTFINVGTVSAPSIGARIWMARRLGLELAVGLNVSSGTTEISSTPIGGGAPVTSAVGVEPSIFGLLLHGGLPMVLSDSGHFSFQLIPELNFGFASGSLENTMAALDWSLSGLLFEIGARVGAEIHFGFIDLPRLSLVASVGLSVRFESRGASQDGPPPVEINQDSSRVGTTLEGDPWDIFTGGLSAIYYL